MSADCVLPSWPRGRPLPNGLSPPLQVLRKWRGKGVSLPLNISIVCPRGMGLPQALGV